MSITELHHAVKRGDTLQIAHYLEAGGDANVRGKFGTTLLMLAAQQGHTPIIDLLLNAGADVNAVSEHSYTALSLAALGGHTRVVEHLLDKGALVPHDAADMPLFGLLEQYGTERQSMIALLRVRATRED